MGISEVSSAHEVSELDGPEQLRQCCAAIRRGRRHLGAAAGVRRRGCSASTASGAAATR
jgi:hypothetical protein